MLVILEGMDKTGKSTVAEYFRKEKRFEYLHMTSPAKWHTRATYLAEMLHLIASTANKNVVMDRSWFGELVWPFVFERVPLLSVGDCSILTEVARMVHHGQVELVLMHDPDHDAHLARIAKFKEPTYNFDAARHYYSDLVKDADFTAVTFQEAEAKGWT